MRICFLILSFIIVIFLPLEGSDWPVFHYDSARTGNSMDKKINLPLKLLWEYKTGGIVRSSPSIVNSVVYVGSYDHKVYAVDMKTGKLKWKYKVEGDKTTLFWNGLFKSNPQSILSSPIVVDGVVYFGAGILMDRPGGFYALDAKTGNLKWEYKTKGGVLSSPVVFGKMVYFVDGALLSLDKDTGKVRWSEERFVVTVKEGEEKVKHAHWSGLSSGKDALYFFGHATYGAILGVDAETGKTKWIVQIRRGKDGSYDSSPAVTDETVYWGFQYWEGPVEGFSVQDGSSKKKFSIYNCYTSPAIANGYLFAGSDDGKVYGCDIKEEKILWNYTTGGKVRSSPAIADGNLFVGSDDGKIYAFTSEK